MSQSSSYTTNHAENWSSNLGFILACIGSAVGLGNLWKFPYITHENGGGAFVLVYLACIVILGIPILIAELVLGRSGKLGIYGSVKKLSCHRSWAFAVSGTCVLCSFFILSFYSVVAGWTVEYFVHSLFGTLSHLSLENVGSRFGAFVSNPLKQIGYHTFFMAITTLLLVRGTKSIEATVKCLMPLLGVLICVIMSLSIYRYGAGESLHFLFRADFSQLTLHGILEALGHAFFTLSVGMGAMVIYGSYLPSSVSLTKSALMIGFFDTLIALMACMMMYPVIFGTNMQLSESASMLFTSLTVQFHTLPGGQFVSALFYLLVAVAALSSTISLLEIVVSFTAEEYNFKRRDAAWIAGGLIWFVGIFNALSNGGSTFLTQLGIMDKLDYITSNWGLPIGGALISMITGWFMSKESLTHQLRLPRHNVCFRAWHGCIKYICPLLIIIIILFKMGTL